MKQYYTIGEISKIYQIGTDSLRYYEKLGILSPRRGANVTYFCDKISVQAGSQLSTIGKTRRKRGDRDERCFES